jgi:hypothetical protein
MMKNARSRKARKRFGALPVHAGQGGLADRLDGLSNQALYAAAESTRMAAKMFRPFWKAANEIDFSAPDDPSAEAVATLD